MIYVPPLNGVCHNFVEQRKLRYLAGSTEYIAAERFIENEFNVIWAENSFKPSAICRTIDKHTLLHYFTCVLATTQNGWRYNKVENWSIDGQSY